MPVLDIEDRDVFGPRIDLFLLAEVVDGVRIGLFVMNSNFRMIFCNAEARRMICQLDVFPHERAAEEFFARLQRVRLHKEDVKRPPKIAGGRDEADRPAMTASLRTVRRPSDGEEFFIGTVICHGTLPTTALQRYGEVHHLTRAETRLLALLYAGLTSTEMADAERVSVHTVRTHVKSIMAKTGNNRQSMLVREISAFARIDPGDEATSVTRRSSGGGAQEDVPRRRVARR